METGADHHPANLSLVDIIDYLCLSPKPVIFVDNTSSEQVAAAYPELLSRKINIATPNKKAFSSDIDLYKRIKAAQAETNALVYHEATVGAGLPVLSTLRDLILTGDKVHKIEGVLSGTMSYLFNNWSPSGKPGTASFSAMVLQAKENGYTEPDPRDDLNGMDVARKVTILARVAGFDISSPTAFNVQSLIPAALESAGSAAEFMQKLPEYDAEFSGVRKDAEEAGKCVRFVGSVDLASGSASVEMKTFDSANPFAALQGSDNLIAFYTERYPKQPLVIQGSGAGGPVTAMGVLADMIKMAERLA